MGSVSVKAFWSDLGVTNAAVGDIIVFNPISASISYINQIEGYNSISTPIQVQVDQFKHNGAYPSDSGAVEAFFLVAGSDTEHAATHCKSGLGGMSCYYVFFKVCGCLTQFPM